MYNKGIKVFTNLFTITRNYEFYNECASTPFAVRHVFTLRRPTGLVSVSDPASEIPPVRYAGTR